MKSLLLFFFLFLMIGAYTQTPVLEADMIQGYMTSQGTIWMVADKSDDCVEIRLLNQDLSERSSFSIQLPLGETASSFYFFYEHFINADDLFEVGVTYGFSTYLYNERGVLLKKFDGVSYLTLSPTYWGYDGDWASIQLESVKLFGYKIVNSELVHLLYDLPLFDGVAVSSAKQEIVEVAYPNPATEHLVIPLSSSIPVQAVLSVFDGNGKLVKQLPVSVTEDFYVLDVSDLSVGVYYYDVAGMRNSFIIKR